MEPYQNNNMQKCFPLQIKQGVNLRKKSMCQKRGWKKRGNTEKQNYETNIFLLIFLPYFLLNFVTNYCTSNATNNELNLRMTALG